MLLKIGKDLLKWGKGHTKTTEKKTTRFYKGVFFRKHKKKNPWVAQITLPKGMKPRQRVVGYYSNQREAALALAKALGVNLNSLRMKKKQIFKGMHAIQGAKKKFKMLQEVWVRKKMYPGCEISCEMPEQMNRGVYQVWRSRDVEL
jgi:hypothetical protein